MKLRVPPTLTFPTQEDAPKQIDIAALDAARAAAPIDPGFAVVEPADATGFKFFATCNVQPEELWTVFERLAESLPEPVGLIIGVKDADPRLLPYTPSADALSVLRLYRRELSTDPFLEFGLTHQHDGLTHEVFVRPAKYIVVWGNDVAAFRRTMRALGLGEVSGLRTLDTFPLISRPLNVVDPSAPYFVDVLDDICDRLGEDPTPSRARTVEH